MKNILITICGRAGSKGVKNKNIRDFLGAPLVAYTIEFAKKVKSSFKEKYNFDISINSDSNELINIAIKYGIKDIIIRSKEHTGDLAPKVPVIIDTTNKMEKKKGIKYELVIDLDITSPIRELNDIKNGLTVMSKENDDCVFSVVEARRNPWFNMVFKDVDGNIKKIFSSEFSARQQAPKVFDMNASIYIYNRRALGTIIKTSPLDGKIGIFEMEDYGILDIDSERDFELMEVIFKHIAEKGKFKWLEKYL